MMNLDIDNSIKNGVLYLYDHQLPNGEFCCYISADDEMKMCVTHSNVFPTSLIAYSLLNLRSIPEVNEILEKCAAFLQYHIMRGGAWNNFTVLNPLFPICPPDVDNTVCASLVLQKLGKPSIDNSGLILANRTTKGLLYTWFTLRPKLNPSKNYWLLSLREFKHPIKTFLFWRNTEASRYDVDAVVNANALLYLGLNEKTIVMLNYMIEIISSEREGDCDSWYRNPFTIYYFFSRNYKAGIKELAPIVKLMTDRILHNIKPDNSFGESVLDTALSIISLINCNHDSIVLDQAIKYLIEQQNRSGGWIRRGVYYGGPKKRTTFGSEEMTTGFCLEALALYKIHKGKQNNEN
ncbi:prenyltransferase/squalene oxidase repeat-containing protein [Pedobacter sp. ASV1-7]|uniref:prenyltransferase/squalene oxidase repeat-containing protein n=1 Tax=Pedobacter sp. ASV1-7 TaxID=3145237 RepID=UPI0032E91796